MALLFSRIPVISGFLIFSKIQKSKEIAEVKIKEFDYDLWTTSDGDTKQYWARVKVTGEVTEISHELMKALRCEEKRLYREYSATAEENAILSLDDTAGDERESWLEDGCHYVLPVEAVIEEEEFRAALTPRQLDVYICCIRGNQTATSYARIHRVTKQSIFDSITAIRKKAKKYFLDT